MVIHPFDSSPQSEGESVLELLSGKDSLRVAKLGGRISLRLDGIQILSPFNALRFDGKAAVSHPCSPNFGPFGKEFGLPQHGPIRNKVLDVSHIPGLNGGIVKISSPVESSGYPFGLMFSQEISIWGGVLRMITKHRNEGNENTPVISGEHFYWNTGKDGWENVLVNDQKIAELIRLDTKFDLESENLITIPGIATVRLRQTGYKTAVCWAMPQGGNVFDQHYFCFEPVEFDPSEFGQSITIIKPGEERVLVIEISLLSNS